MSRRVRRAPRSTSALRALERRENRSTALEELRRSAPRWWRRARGYLILLGVVTSVALGWVGLAQDSAARHLDWGEHLYETLLLFKFNQPAGRWNGPLQAAMWIAPLTTLYAAFRAAALVYYDQWTRLRIARFGRGHVVVLGFGRVGSRLAIGFAQAGVKVFVVDHMSLSERRSACREHGIAYLAGDVGDALLVAQAGLERASVLIVAAGNDALNARATLTALPIARRGRGRIRCYVHIDEERLCTMLEQAAFGEPSDLEFFNVYRAGPRALLDASGIGVDGDWLRNVVVVGAGAIAANVVVEVARRRAIDPDVGEDVLVTLVAPSASALVDKMRARYPELESASTVVGIDLDVSDPLLATDLELSIAEPARSVVFVCEEDDGAGVRSTLRLRELLDEAVPIVLCSSSSADSTSLLQLAGTSALPNVEGFALLDRVCRPEVLLNSERELVAQTIHTAYVREERRRGVRPAEDPSLVAWEELPEILRVSNRAQADDIGNKLRLVGKRISTTPTWRPPVSVFSEDEVEQLAQREHVRWMEERLANGWTFGAERDALRKTTPSLVSWSELDEHDKDRDREVVRALPIVLARAGFSVVSARARPARADP